MKQGSVLVEMDMDGYRPLGAFGQPVHKSYVQLQAAVRQRLGARCADLFARPQWDERSRKIRWVAPVPGEARAWKDLEPAEQTERALDLQIIRAEFETYLGELRAAGAAADGKSGGEAFASVLDQALKTPNDGHLHFVGEQPVMTFWGFSELSGARFDPLAAAPAAAPANEEQPRRAGFVWWPWLLLALLALLLLALLLWWLFWRDAEPVSVEPRAPAIEEPVEPTREPVVEPPVEPETRVVPPAPVELRDRQGRVYDPRRLTVDGQGRVIGPDGRVIDGITPEQLREAQAAIPDGAVTNPDGTLEIPDGAADTPDGTIDTPEGVTPGDGTDPAAVDPNGDGDAATTPEQPADPETPPADATTPDGETPADATNPPALDGTTPETPDGQGDGQGDGAEAPGSQLEVPEAAATPPASDQTDPTAPDATSPVPQGKPVPLDFVRGKWRSRSALADEQGNRIDQTYEFDRSGKGTSIIRRADGTTCKAPAQARMEGGQLKIEELENLRCTDGQRFEKSQTVCTRGADGKTKCKGSGFDVTIERP